jgi:hypothetical protein
MARQRDEPKIEVGQVGQGAQLTHNPFGALVGASAPPAPAPAPAAPVPEEPAARSAARLALRRE